MKASELRINNTVLNNGDVFTIQHGYEIDDAIHEYEPIHITEEWLLKLGFETGMLNTWSIIPIDTYAIISLGKKADGFYMTNLPIKVNHVHQLQNLYFAITGEELTIKE